MGAREYLSRELVGRRQIKVLYVPSTRQHGDIPTLASSTTRFRITKESTVKNDVR